MPTINIPAFLKTTAHYSSDSLSNTIELSARVNTQHSIYPKTPTKITHDDLLHSLPDNEKERRYTHVHTLAWINTHTLIYPIYPSHTSSTEVLLDRWKRGYSQVMSHKTLP